MMVSTKGRYALRTMIDLAQHADGSSISLSDIAKRQQISVKYLEAVISTLNKGGLVISKMGKKGGYRLAKEPKDYTIGEILKLTEGNLAPVACLKEENSCERAGMCMTLPMWQEVKNLITDYFEQITLEDLLNGNVKRDRER